MMMRKGYSSEYKAKQDLIQKYGEGNIIKVAIGQFGGDFIIIDHNKIIKIVEVKSSHNKYLDGQRVMVDEQIERIRVFCKERDIPFEVWFYKIGPKSSIKEVYVFEEDELVHAGC
jgi:hypothetical protein